MLKAGRNWPTSKLKAWPQLSGNMVILLPGKYTVDKRWNTTFSMGLLASITALGAAMCMPTRTVPLSKCCTDKASSISVVSKSSIEKAFTLAATGNWLGISGTGMSAKPVPCLKNSNSKPSCKYCGIDFTAPMCSANCKKFFLLCSAAKL